MFEKGQKVQITLKKGSKRIGRILGPSKFNSKYMVKIWDIKKILHILEKDIKVI